jgi:hypothetical protein
MVAVNVLIALILCTVVGAFTGLVLGGVFGPLYLAIIAGILATVVAIAARNIKIPELVVVYSALSIERPVPLRVSIFCVLASIIGSLAAVQVATMAGVKLWSVLGALAGFFAGVLMVMIVVLSEPPPRATGNAGSS